MMRGAIRTYRHTRYREGRVNVSSFKSVLASVQYDTAIRFVIDPHNASFGISPDVRAAARAAALASPKEYYVHAAIEAARV